MVNILQAAGGTAGLSIEIKDPDTSNAEVIEVVKQALYRSERLNYAKEVFEVLSADSENTLVLLFSECFGYQAGWIDKSYSEFEYYLEGYLDGYFQDRNRVVVRHLPGHNLAKLEENQTELRNLGNEQRATISITCDGNEDLNEIRGVVTWNTDNPEIIGQFFYQEDRERILKLGVA